MELSSTQIYLKVNISLLNILITFYFIKFITFLYFNFHFYITIYISSFPQILFVSLISRLMSRDFIECVRAPTEIRSTPVDATVRIVSSSIPPEASSKARPATNSTASRMV